MRIRPAHVNTYVIQLHLQLVYLNCIKHSDSSLIACLESELLTYDSRRTRICGLARENFNAMLFVARVGIQ